MTGQLGYLWAVAAVVWLGIFGYVLSLIRRQSRVDKELSYIEHALQDVTDDERGSRT